MSGIHACVRIVVDRDDDGGASARAMDPQAGPWAWTAIGPDGIVSGGWGYHTQPEALSDGLGYLPQLRYAYCEVCHEACLCGEEDVRRAEANMVERAESGDHSE